MRECEGHVGSDRYLIQACKQDSNNTSFRQTSLQSLTRAFIFDTCDELKKAKEQRYQRKAVDSQTA
jgi:hypothetical protein